MEPQDLFEQGLSNVKTIAIIGSVLSAAGMGIGLYHGYKRNCTTGSSVLWGLLGAAFAPIVIPVALIQGLGKPRPGSACGLHGLGESKGECIKGCGSLTRGTPSWDRCMAKCWDLGE